jgi:hypothetical protein
MSPSFVTFIVGIWIALAVPFELFVLMKAKGHENDKMWIGWACISTTLLIMSAVFKIIDWREKRKPDPFNNMQEDLIKFNQGLKDLRDCINKNFVGKKK